MNEHKELLENAAKAFGIKCWWSGKDFCFGHNGNLNIPVPWNPLEDDGDALRLAVKLKIDLMVNSDRIDAFAECGNAAEYLYELPRPTDPYAAARRAIVRAAAEIGKSMP